MLLFRHNSDFLKLASKPPLKHSLLISLNTKRDDMQHADVNEANHQPIVLVLANNRVRENFEGNVISKNANMRNLLKATYLKRPNTLSFIK